METTDKEKIVKAVRKINECDEVLTYFKENSTLYDKDFLNEVVIEFEKDKKLQVAKMKMLKAVRKLKELDRDQEQDID